MTIIIGSPGRIFRIRGERVSAFMRLRLWFSGFWHGKEDPTGNDLFIALSKCEFVAAVPQEQMAKAIADAQAQQPGQTKRIIEPTAMIPSKRRAN